MPDNSISGNDFAGRRIKRILVTRPRDDARDTAAKLAAIGYETLAAPLLEIRFRPGPRISLAGVQAILATSSNGIRALAARTRTRDRMVFAVGAQTAEAARAEGFLSVKDAAGDARALIEAASHWATTDGGMLLHAAGAHTQGTVVADLHGLGFETGSVTLYDAVAVEQLPTSVESAMRAGELDAVLFYSPRSGRIFADLVRKAGLCERCIDMAAFCISAATAGALAPLAFREIRIAAHPDGDAMLGLLCR